MSDERRRRLERAAAQGDPRARFELFKDRVRAGEVELASTPEWTEVVGRVGLLAAAEPADSGSACRAHLTEDLAPLDALEAGWAPRALAFVEWGQDDGLLRDLAAADAAGALQLKESGFRVREGARPVFERPLGAPALARLGILYRAALADPRPRRRDRRTPLWLDTLLLEASDAEPHTISGRQSRCRLSARAVEGALRFAGLPPGLAAERCFLDFVHGLWDTLEPVLLALDGFGDALAARFPEVVRAALRDPKPQNREHALEALAACGTDLTPWIPELVTAATGNARAVQRLALPLLRQVGPSGLAGLREALLAGRPAQRARAAPLLGAWGGAAERELLAEQVGRDRSAKVRAAIAEALARPPARTQPDEPPVPPLTAEAEAALRAAWREVSDARLQEALRQVADPRPWAAAPAPCLPRLADAARRRLARRAEVAPAHLARAAWLTGALTAWETEDTARWALVDLALDLATNLRARGGDAAVELSAAEAALRAAGLPARAIGAAAFYPRLPSRGFLRAGEWLGWAAFAARHPETLVRAVEGLPAAVGSWRTSLHAALRYVLTQVGEPPPAARGALVRAALSKAKGDRATLQPFLRGPEVQAAVVAALEDGKQHVRAAAAEWLVELAGPAALTPLEQALRRERRPAARRAIEQAVARARGA